MRLPLRGTVALLASLPEPANGLGLPVTIHMAGPRISDADFGRILPARTRRHGERERRPLSPATTISRAVARFAAVA